MLIFKNLNKVPNIGILVTGDVVGLFTSIPLNKGPEILKKQFESFDEKSIPRKIWLKQLNLFSKVITLGRIHESKISCRAFGTKFAPL